MNKSTFTIAAFLASSLVAFHAGATPNFPGAIQSDLSLSYTPDCSLCHTDGDQGGIGTVNTPFGKNMRARGLVEYDTSSLQKALAAMESEKVTSAGGCVPDIEELKEGNNPNSPGDSASCDGGTASTTSSDSPTPATPGYGCGAEIAPPTRASVGSSGAIVAFLVASLALVRRTGARRRRLRR